MNEHLNRINKLRKLISSDTEALLITSNANVYYFTGFNNSEGTVLITSDKAYMFVDFRYIETAKNIVNSCEVIMHNSLLEELNLVLSDNKINKVYIESKNLSVYKLNNLNKSLLKINVSVVTNEVLDNKIENLRVIKSALEIEYIQKAQEITEKAYNDILPLIKPDAYEKDIALELEYRMKKYGAEDVSFDLITITGTKTSLPHGVPSNKLIKQGDFFTMDIGALYKGYHSDMTRTVAVGKISDEQQKIYDIVYNAQVSALSNVCAGNSCFNVDKTARDIITNAGYGKCFGHATGHGVGLDIHENPSVSPRSDTILSEGMIITVEPGIYIENKFGVRIEDMVLITKNGYKNFAKLPKELIIL